MCSTTDGRRGTADTADIASRLAQAIDELAASIGPGDVADPGLAARLAAAWATITAADPELAARAAGYCDELGRERGRKNAGPSAPAR